MSSGTEFLLARIYERFHAKWNLPARRGDWARSWAEYLDPATPEELRTVADFCEATMRRCPTFPEFRILLQRHRNNEELSKPIVSIQERIAFLILTADEFIDADPHALADGCLIAGAVLHAKSYEHIDVPAEGIVAECAGRARMFAEEAEHWKTDSAAGKGFWSFFFKGPAGVD